LGFQIYFLSFDVSDVYLTRLTFKYGELLCLEVFSTEDITVCQDQITAQLQSWNVTESCPMLAVWQPS